MADRRPLRPNNHHIPLRHQKDIIPGSIIYGQHKNPHIDHVSRAAWTSMATQDINKNRPNMVVGLRLTDGEPLVIMAPFTHYEGVRVAADFILIPVD
jgi:hypothetical protein